MNRSAMLGAAALAAAMAAAACSREEASATRDIAARVNGGDVPLARVEAALARGGAGTKDAAARALESAIDEELLVQKALAARLDRDPAVTGALEASRRRILARAWLDNAVDSRAKPDPEQVRRFYTANPALFGARRIYALRELRLVGAPPRSAALRAAAATGDATRVESWLAREGLRYETHEATEPAEAVPLALLARLQSMKDGEVAVVEDDGALAVVELLRSIPAPLAEEQAAPLIERFLASRRRMSLARDEIARLRSEARIEYLGVPAPGARVQEPRPAVPAVPVNASLQPASESPDDMEVAATVAAPGKDERS